MVRLSYQKDIDETYAQVRESACGRQACTVLILIANEVDAMASCRMLTQLLRIDNIAYALRPVSNFDQVFENYEAFMTSEIKTVILINCGAMHNIPKIFKMERGGDTRCIIFDNHRPIHLGNIHSRHAVVVFDDASEIDADSAFIPSDHSDDDEASESEKESSDSDEGDDEDEDDRVSDSGSEGEAEENFEENNDGDGEGDGNDEEKDGDDTKFDNENANESGGEGVEEKFSRSELESSPSAWSSGRKDKRRRDQDAQENNRAELDRSGEQTTNDEDDDEGPVRVVGRRRKALAEVHDPVKVRRRKLREYYAGGASYSAPTAMMLMNLVWGRAGANVPLDLVWQAILGVTDQYQRAHLSDEYYAEVCAHLRILLSEHVDLAADRVRYTVGEGDEQTVVSGAEAGHIEEVPEFRFFLYRHWSIFDAMYHSPYIASKMPVWQAQGTSRLKELLAKMGIPLYQCEQTYAFMAPGLKNHFRQQITNESIKAEYNLQSPDVTYRSFFRYNGFKNPVGASDVVYATSSLLEMFSSSSSSTASGADGGETGDVSTSGARTGGVVSKAEGVQRQAAFNKAYDCLSMQSESLLKEGVLAALSLQRMIVKKAAVMIEAHESLQKLNRLYFAYVHQSVSVTTSTAEGEMDAAFTRPLVLARLGQFIMEVKLNTSKRSGGWVGRKNVLPLILCSEKKNSYIIVGISPLGTTRGAGDLSEEDQNAIRQITNFRQFFMLAAREINTKPLNESFDSDVVEIAKNDTQDFLGVLDEILKAATRNYFTTTASGAPEI